MITKGQIHIVQKVSELPDLTRCTTLYLDLETTAFDDKIRAFHPYKGHRACGIAITGDDIPDAWYIPIRHLDDHWNVDLDTVLAWLQLQLAAASRWVNHNVKFDARFLDAEELKFDHLELVDTLTLAKLIDSDRLSHDLKNLCREWLKMPMDEEKRVVRYLEGIKSNDYAAVPADLLGEYACMDVIGVRELYRHLITRRDGDMSMIWDQEIALTPVLLDMERDGLRVDVTQTRIDSVLTIRSIIAAKERIKELTGVELKDSPDVFYDILCVQLGLPVLTYTEETEKGGGGNPSFDKDTLLSYSALPEVVTNPVAKEVVENLQTFRTEHTYMGLFLDALLELRDKMDHVHPVYNQVVRTGRMSCSEPNGQQFNARAKRLIVPEPGEVFLCYDASQIEFRIITHYCQNEEAIAAYVNDPGTDYHLWVANLIGVERRPAKTLNFAMAYGAGRARVQAQLGGEKVIVDQVIAMLDELGVPPDQRATRYEMLLAERTAEIYKKYHARLPELRKTAEKARAIATARGYIRNLYGRRRHLNVRFCHKAFNSLVQGCAMDVIKERMVAACQRYDPWMRERGIRLRANVHDELLYSLPAEVLAAEPTIPDTMRARLEDVQMKFRVPFYFDGGQSDKNWAEAKK